MAIGLLNYMAAGAGQAMGHVADAAYAHWEDRDLQDQKDQAEAKKEARINEARIAARNEQEAHVRGSQFKEDTANAVREGAINQTKADIEKNRMLLQEKTNPGTVNLENQVRTDAAVGTTKADLASKDIITQHDQNPDLIKKQSETELLKGTLAGENKAEFERQRSLTTEGIKADNAARAAARKLDVETRAKEAEGNKWTAEAGKQRAEAYAKAMEPDTKLIEQRTKAIEQINNAMKEIPDEGEAKMALKEALQAQLGKLNQAQDDADAHHDQLLGIKKEPVNAGDMPPADTETSTSPGGGSVPAVPAAAVPAAAAAVPAAAKPTGAINTTEKPTSSTSATESYLGLYGGSGSDAQLRRDLLATPGLTKEQSDYLRRNPSMTKILTENPAMYKEIRDKSIIAKETKKAEDAKQLELDSAEKEANIKQSQTHTAAKQRLMTDLLQGKKMKEYNKFVGLTRQQQDEELKKAGYLK
jgi:hypothetical protein